MNFIEQEFIPKKVDKSKKLSKVLLILIIILVIAIIATICVIMALKKEPFKVELNGEANTDIKPLIVFEEDKVYIPIKDIAQYLNYSSFNGSYTEKSEESDKCYVEIDEEVANFSVNSNKIEKIDKKTNETTHYLIDEPVKLIDGKLYTTPDGIFNGFNTIVKYNKDKNKLIIQTMDYILDFYKGQVEELNYAGLMEDFDSAKASLKDLVIVKDSRGYYGIYDMNAEKEVLEAKYDSIVYLPSTEMFIVEGNGKKGIVDEKGKVKVKIQYEEIVQLSQDLKIYLVQQDGKYGIIDIKENAVLPSAFDKIGVDIKKFEDSNINNSYIILSKFIPVMKDDKWALYSLAGDKITDFNYDGFGCVISSQNKKYRSVLAIAEHNIIVGRRDKKFYLIDENGKEMVNGMDFDNVYMEIEAGTPKYYLSRNDATVELEKVLNKLNKNE